MNKKELERKIKEFNEGIFNLPFEKYLKTIARNSKVKLDIENGIVIINNREFEIIDMYRPNIKASNFEDNESTYINLKRDKYLIEYRFSDKSDTITCATIYEEDENGYFLIGNKRYMLKEIIGKEKIENLGDIEEISQDLR